MLHCMWLCWTGLEQGLSRLQVKIMGSFMPESSKYRGVLEVPDPWFDDDAERRGFYRVNAAPAGIDAIAC